MNHQDNLSGDEKINIGKKVSAAQVEEIFSDFEARQNLVGFYDLAYKVDKRINPHLYSHD